MMTNRTLLIVLAATAFFAIACATAIRRGASERCVFVDNKTSNSVVVYIEPRGVRLGRVPALMEEQIDLPDRMSGVSVLVARPSVGNLSIRESPAVPLSNSMSWTWLLQSHGSNNTNRRIVEHGLYRSERACS